MHVDMLNNFINRNLFMIQDNMWKEISIALQESQKYSFETLIFNQYKSNLIRLSYSQYIAKDKNKEMFENHRMFCDLHVLIEGEELFYQYPLRDINQSNYDKARDISIFKVNQEKTNCVRLYPGVAVFVTPMDAHMPGISLSQNQHPRVKKLVIKIPWFFMQERKI